MTHCSFCIELHRTSRTTRTSVDSKKPFKNVQDAMRWHLNALILTVRCLDLTGQVLHKLRWALFPELPP
eukprot:309163-Amphidinium_carterae.1